MFRNRAAFALLVLLLPMFTLAGEQRQEQKDEQPHRAAAAVVLLDEEGKPREQAHLGANVRVAATGLQPGRQYDVYLRDDAGTYVSMLRFTADASGTLAPSILWFQSGVTGCSKGVEPHLKLPYRFRTFEEAEAKLAAARFALELRDHEQTLAKRSFRFASERAPTIYFSDANGCLLNSSDGSEAIYVTGRNFLPGAIVEISVASHQKHWRMGDPIREVRRIKETQTVRLTGAQTGFTTQVWARGVALVGAYDVIARPFQSGSDRALTPFVHPMDVVGWDGDVGIVVFERSRTHLVEQIAGEIVAGYPWFRNVDSFPLGRNVWGALDPKRKPIGHPGTFATWYVVDHQNTWTNGDPLIDVSGGYEITPVKPGCINSTETLLWSNPNPTNVNAANPTRPYDVVIDFGNLSSTLGLFMTDGVYTEGIDFVDYRGAVGFYLVRDPRLNGSFQTADVEEPAMGSGCNVDLDGITINWTDPVFYPGQNFQVAIGDDDMGSEDGRCADPTKVDMRAHIYYPKDPMSSAVAPGGPFPVAVFYHGQQAWSIPGYLGYEYLGTLLASHGFIVYSIDARSLLNATIASRGEHIRAHLRKLVGINATGSGSIFSQQMDLNNVSLIGHSRGGDSIVAAFEWQRVQPDAGYTIKALVAIAPVQFFDSGGLGWSPPEPAFAVHLRDVAYMIIQGSKDGDVADFEGLRTYDRAADIRLLGQTPKAMVFVKDANHNYFNSVWETQEGSDYSGAGLLSAAEQQDTARVYIHSFLEAYQKGKKEYLDYFTGVLAYPGNATVATDFQAPSSDYLVVDHFEVIPPTPHDKTTNAAGGAVTTPGISDYEERQLAATQPAPWSSYMGETYAASLSWDAPTDAYATEVPLAVRTALDWKVTPYLSLRVGQVFRQTGSPNPSGANQNFAVRLRDTNGNFSPWVFANSFGKVHPPWDNTAWGGIKTVMGVIRIPLQAFTVNTGSLVDLTQLDRIEFDFLGNPAGEIVFDDIRFTK